VLLSHRLQRQWPVFGIVLATLCLATLLGMLAAVSGEAALLLGVILVLSGVILLSHHFGVWWMCLLFPLSQTLLVPRQVAGITGLNPVNLLMAATVLSLLLAWIMARLRHQPIRMPPLPRPLVWLYILPITLAALHGMLFVDSIAPYFHQIKAIAFDSPGSYLRDALLRPMFLVVFSLLVAMVFRDARNPKLYLLPCLLASLLVAGLIACVIAWSGLSLTTLATPRARSFLSGLGMHANEISLLLNGALALSLFSMRGAQGTQRLLLAICVALFSSAVVLTFSRGGFLGLAVVYVAFLLHANSPRSALAALLLAALVLLLIPDAAVERATEGIAAGNGSAITAGRHDAIWPHVIPLILDAPLLGGGLMSILWSPPAKSGLLSAAQAHNAYLGLLMDMGIVGATMVWAFMFWAWRELRAASHEAPEAFYRHFFAGAAVTIPLLFAQGISDDRFTPTVPQTLMWFAIGAAIGYRERLRSATQS
jgi:O-antigen ligase